MIIELFILKVKVQTIRHGDLTWPKMKWIQFVMLTSSSVTTSSSYGEMSERNPTWIAVPKYSFWLGVFSPHHMSILSVQGDSGSLLFVPFSDSTV